MPLNGCERSLGEFFFSLSLSFLSYKKAGAIQRSPRSFLNPQVDSGTKVLHPVCLLINSVARKSTSSLTVISFWRDLFYWPLSKDFKV